MKVKKDVSKNKKKKNRLEKTTNPSIKKVRLSKSRRVKKDSEVAVAVKKGFEESQREAECSISGRQNTWMAYLKVFLASEKLNKTEKMIMEFCTNKGLTPPRRKQKFLNFIRNCYGNQKEVSDELCYDLFDSILEKYDDYKDGKYTSSNSNAASTDQTSTIKLSKNKKKKMKRSSTNDSKNSLSEKAQASESKRDRTISKEKKHQSKVPSDSSEDDEDDMETDDE